MLDEVDQVKALADRLAKEATREDAADFYEELSAQFESAGEALREELADEE
jgi:hypothetical protein